MSTGITIEVSPGELVDKITILEIKLERIEDQQKLVNVARELNLLLMARDAMLPENDEVIDNLTLELFGINETLWEIEDDIRLCEATGDFGPRFVALARSVYKTNDLRAAVKRAINEHLGSPLMEEKSYSDP